jgi:uncharacterized protein YdaU (DUF1376 family)
MHYYQHNIGDYRKDTSHLTLLEHGIYRQLLDTYYLDEEPLSNDLAKLMRSHSVRNADEQQALQNVLTDFFELTENGYFHKRCEDGIAQFHGKSAKARASANVRWANELKVNKPIKIKRNANVLPTHSESNANGMLTKNQEPITSIKTIIPKGVSNEVFNDYLKLRKGLKAPVTETAIKGLAREASKANMTLEQVMVMCCQNGWRGFKAEWINKIQPKQNVNFI